MFIRSLTGASFRFASFHASASSHMGRNTIVWSPKEDSEGMFQARRSKIDLFSLGGYESVIERVADLVRYLQNPKELKESGLQPFKGVILSGPPGVGKSLLAEAVAGHAGVPIISVSGPEMQNSLVGATEGRLRELFKQAKSIAPCVLCIDEIETVAARRISPGESEPHTQTLAYHINSRVNQLLSLLSQDNAGVIVIGTTNNFEMIDEAVIRPGRIDRHIALSLPNQVERATILEIHTKNKKLGSAVSLKELAAISAEYSGAELAGWVNEAGLCALRENSKAIEAHHFDEARTLLEVGVLSQSFLTPRQKFLVAAHEAGHAIVGHLLNQKIYKVSTYQHGNTSGYTEWLPTEEVKIPEKSVMLNHLCMVLAGRAAELVLKSPTAGSESDLTKAKAIVQLMVEAECLGLTFYGSVKEMEGILQSEMRRAKDLIEQNKKTWELVRDALIEHEELSREEFLKILGGEPLTKKRPPRLRQILLPSSKIAKQ